MRSRYVIITEKKIEEHWWEKIPIREISMAIVGAILTLTITMIANHASNNEQFQKEWREKQETFVDNYFKDLSGRFALCLNLLTEESNEKKNDQLIRDYTRNMENERLKMLNTNVYDSLQFHRFKLDRYYTRLKTLNKKLNIFFQYVEAANDDELAIEGLTAQESSYLVNIKQVEGEVFKELDSEVNTKD